MIPTQGRVAVRLWDIAAVLAVHVFEYANRPTVRRPAPVSSNERMIQR